MERPILLITLVVILVGLPTIVVFDTPPVDSDTPTNEIATSQIETGNSSASGISTITWITASLADE